MANKNIFGSATPGKTPPVATAVNEAGGIAFNLSDKQALAQYAVTGTFNDTYYTKGADQVKTVLDLCAKIDVNFIAKVALYSRTQGRMKDMPAILCAHLTTRGPEGAAVLRQIFPVVIGNGKMLRNFVQMMRSGVVGRKSLGSGPKKLVRAWFQSKKPDDIFRQSLGNDPSFADVIKMVHPTPDTAERRALFGYLANVEAEKSYSAVRRGKDGLKREVTIHNYNPKDLPQVVKDYEAFKVAKETGKEVEELPKVPWEMLQGLKLSAKDWKALARQATWTQVRMNLNTFARHGALADSSVVADLANKLKNPEEIEKAKPFPYQLFTAYNNIEAGTPRLLVEALHDAVELSTKNVPTFDGEMHVAVDTSGSMSTPVTGARPGATTKTTCVHVAALIASVFLRKNPNCNVLPFDTSIRNVKLEPRDSIMTNANKLAMGGGGTDCSVVLRHLNDIKAKGNLVVYLSDNESWAGPGYGRTTGMQAEWEKYRARNPKAKLVCIDLAVAATSQVVNDKSTLNIGGWSDAMFEVIQDFLNGNTGPDAWIQAIEAMQLPAKS